MSSRYQEVELTRACEAIAIPYGTPITLEAGIKVVITQTLGSFTVMNEFGQMARIDREDADALGVELPPEEKGAGADDENLSLQERVMNQMKTCYDPEIPVNIVELGLIYRCDVHEIVPGDYRVEVDMTLTAPGCGMGDVIRYDVERKIKKLSGVVEVDVQLTFEPPWTAERMTEEARLDLGMM